MNVRKFLTTTMTVTMAALIYVSQQTALVRLSYDIKNKEKSYSELLDRNKILLYNVRQLESPARLEKVLLARNIKLEVPSREHVILASAPPVSTESKETGTALGLLGKIRQTAANIFALGPEAQARPVK